MHCLGNCWLYSQFEKLLNNTSYSNMLVQACRLYLECDYVISTLEPLTNFTFYLTMLFLNCVEKTDQNDLVKFYPNYIMTFLILICTLSNNIMLNGPRLKWKNNNQTLILNLICWNDVPKHCRMCEDAMY